MLSKQVSDTYPMWSAHVNHLLGEAPAVVYPEPGPEFVRMGGVCGLGHRLERNAKIYHLARSLGYRVAVDWFPYSEIFGQSAYLGSMPEGKRALRYFENEAGALRDLSGTMGTSSLIRFEDLQCPDFCDFNLSRNSNASVLRRRIFKTAASAYAAQFYTLLVSLLRDPWIERIENFLQSFSGLPMVGLHMRTGNGERGDFAQKGRQVDSTLMLDTLLQDLEDRFADQDIAIFVASDDPGVYNYLKRHSPYSVSKFASLFPQEGVVTGDWTSGESVVPSRVEDRVQLFFEAFADMCLLGFSRDLYVSAWTSFVTGSCIFHRLSQHPGGALKVFDEKASLWYPC